MDVQEWSDWVNEANESLASLENCSFQWCYFGPPCQSFHLLVKNSTGGNVAIVLVHTSYLKGPTGGQVKNLKVTWNENPDNSEFILEDQEVGFRAVSKSFSWKKNLKPDEKMFSWHPPIQ